MLLLGISTCMTANAWIHLFNRAGILLLFCTGMLHQMYEDSRWSFSANLKQLLFFCRDLLRITVQAVRTYAVFYIKAQGSKF